MGKHSKKPPIPKVYLVRGNIDPTAPKLSDLEGAVEVKGVMPQFGSYAYDQRHRGTDYGLRPGEYRIDPLTDAELGTEAFKALIELQGALEEVKTAQEAVQSFQEPKREEKMLYWAEVTEVHAKNDRVAITVEMSAENYAKIGYEYPDSLAIHYEPDFEEDDNNLGPIESSGPFEEDFSVEADDARFGPCAVCGDHHTFNNGSDFVPRGY